MNATRKPVVSKAAPGSAASSTVRDDRGSLRAAVERDARRRGELAVVHRRRAADRGAAHETEQAAVGARAARDAAAEETERRAAIGVGVLDRGAGGVSGAHARASSQENPASASAPLRAPPSAAPAALASAIAVPAGVRGGPGQERAERSGRERRDDRVEAAA
jgi:hypothetical protein